MTKTKTMADDGPPPLPDPVSGGCIHLLADWGKYPGDTILTILRPGEELKNGYVDVSRAAQLVADGLALAGAPEPAETPAPKPARTKKGAR